MLSTETKSATIEDYERLPEGAPYQLIGGELIMTPSPTFSHQWILSNLFQALDTYAVSKNLGRFFCAPLDVRLGDEDVFQPDLIFIKKERLKLTGRKTLEIVPDLVIEILSLSTGYYDFTRKKAMYYEHGVEEYWIVDPESSTIEVFALIGGAYQAHSRGQSQARVSSRLLQGFEISFSELAN